MREKIILVGGGGHCRSIIDVIEAGGHFDIEGIVDTEERIGTQVLGYSVIGCDKDLQTLCGSVRNFCIALGHVKSTIRRRELYTILKMHGAHLPVIISPTARVSKWATVAEGTVIMHQVVVNANATIGVCGIVNTSAVIEHDVVIGDHCHIGPMAVLNGNCLVGSDNLIGSNAVLLPGITAGNNVIVAAGCVVTKPVHDNILVAGNPGVLKRKL